MEAGRWSVWSMRCMNPWSNQSSPNCVLISELAGQALPTSVSTTGSGELLMLTKLLWSPDLIVFRSLSFLLSKMGEGRRGKCCHGNLISSSSWQPAGGPALHLPAEGPHSHLEEGTVPHHNPQGWLAGRGERLMTMWLWPTGSLRHTRFELEGERRVFLVHS